MGIDLHQQRFIKILLLGVDLGLETLDRCRIGIDRRIIDLHRGEIFLVCDIGHAPVSVFPHHLHACQQDRKHQTGQQHEAPAAQCQKQESGKAHFPDLRSRMVSVRIILITQVYSSQKAPVPASPAGV